MKDKRTPEQNLSEAEMNNLTDEKLKAIVIKLLTELGKIIDEHHENFDTELEIIKRKNQR